MHPEICGSFARDQTSGSSGDLLRHNLLEQSGEFCIGSVFAGPWFQAAYGSEPGGGASIEHIARHNMGLHQDRNPDVARDTDHIPKESARRHSDNREWRAVEEDGSSENRRVAPKSAFPKPVTDYGDRSFAWRAAVL